MKLIDEEILEITPGEHLNGLGPKGFGWLVPDWLGFVNLELAGNIHDAMYWAISINKTQNYKVFVRERINIKKYWWLRNLTQKHADTVFYSNLKIINKEMSPSIIGYHLRKPILWLYYQAVKRFGKHFVR